MFSAPVCLMALVSSGPGCSVMKDEVAAMRGRDAFDSFYKKLTQAKEYHQRHPDLPVKHQVGDMASHHWSLN
jgi:hypothetical protein